MSESDKHKNCQIILIEDSFEDAELFQTFWRKENIPIEIIHFSDGEKGLEHLVKISNSKNSPMCSLVILDLNLPKRTGKEILKEIKCATTKSIRVIVFSGSESAQEKAQCIELGASAFITKPVDLSGYREFISQSLIKELKAICPSLVA